MLKHKSFAYFIILKREFVSGYMRKKPTNPTKLKYFNHLIKVGLISGTKNGYRLMNLRGAIHELFGYQFKIVDYSDNLLEMSNFILDSLVYNKLLQQSHSAKAYLVAKKWRVAKGGQDSLKNHLLAGRATVMTSCRSIGKTLGISHVTANLVLNRLVKSGYVIFNIVKNKITKKEYNHSLFTFNCERYLTQIFKVHIKRISECYPLVFPNPLPIM